jgi:hypothetical protein
LNTQWLQQGCLPMKIIPEKPNADRILPKGALIHVALLGSLPVIVGLSVLEYNINNAAQEQVVRATREAVRQLDQILDQAHEALVQQSPVSGQYCAEPMMAAMHRETAPQAYPRSTVTASAGPAFSSHWRAPLHRTLEGPGHSQVSSADVPLPQDDLGVYGEPQAFYAVLPESYGDVLEKSLRKVGKQVELLVEIGTAPLDASTPVWADERSKQLVFGRTLVSSRYDYRVHGGIPPDQLQSMATLQRRQIVGSLLVNGLIIAGLAYTLMRYRGAHRLSNPGRADRSQ